ncbi:MAG TPA: phosphoenolpyruvate carboxylase, partial [Thermomicrobiales bacterium]|nr:phosphoenolpyruvate carboxylase [Thermomicrobiales bacterium]
LVASANAEDSPEPATLTRYRAAVDEMARASVAAYRALVYGDPEFVAFFEQATPIREIARLQLGSRPARRTASSRIEDLRAIPWVFAWTQARIVLPGWYGLGAGLALGEARFGLDLLREMYAEWPFFRTLLANAALALAKSDLAIAERYTALVEPPSLATRFLPQIRDEHERTTRLVLQVTGSERLLDGEPVLRRSIDRRNPYVDPLSFVQIDALRRLRAAPEAEDALRTVLLTVNGIAGGLKNTG